MVLKSLVVLSLILTSAGASASPCADKLTGPLLIGDANPSLEESAKHAAVDQLEDIPVIFVEGANIRVGINLSHAEGLFVVDTKLNWQTLSYYVHVAEMGPAKVERIVQMSKESEKDFKKVARKSINEWLEKNDHKLPGFWTGGPPQVHKAAIERVFATAHNTSLVIFNLTVTHVTPQEVTLYSAMEIRDGKVQILTQPQFRTPEPTAEEEELKALQRLVKNAVRKKSAFTLPPEIRILKIDVKKTAADSSKTQFKADVIWRVRNSDVGWKTTYFVEAGKTGEMIVQWLRSDRI